MPFGIPAIGIRWVTRPHGGEIHKPEKLAAISGGFLSSSRTCSFSSRDGIGTMHSYRDDPPPGGRLLHFPKEIRVGVASHVGNLLGLRVALGWLTQKVSLAGDCARDVIF